MIKNRNLVAGQKLQARYKGQDHLAEVVTGESGKAALKLDDGTVYKSVSSAGQAITGGAVNGWQFWSIVGGEGEAPADAPKPRSRKKKEASADGAENAEPVGTAIPQGVLAAARERAAAADEPETGELSDADAAQEEGDNAEEGDGDDDSAKITCNECGLEFDDTVQASEHFNDVHAA